MAKAAGEKIPLGWAVDADGTPTTDPTAALAGALVSSGGYKGWGFGLMAEVLAAGMTGSVNSLDVSGLKVAKGKPHDLGQFYILIEPGADFGARLSRIAHAVADQDGARIPGQNRRPMTEIDVPDALWSASRALATS
jgi:(2R)-3-sulfolactate dehydrogenase (NADP+)